MIKINISPSLLFAILSLEMSSIRLSKATAVLFIFLLGLFISCTFLFYHLY
jgi:hypothetical protein